MSSNTPAGHDEHELRKWGVGYGGKTGEFMGRYVELDETGTKAIIERPAGGTREEYLWHLSPTDLAYIQTDLARLPESVQPCAIAGGESQVLNLSLDDLAEGPIESLSNPALPGSQFIPLNQAPVVETIDGRKGLRMQRRHGFFDMLLQISALDQFAPATMGYRQPFTASAWVRPNNNEGRIILGWHAPTGDHGVSLAMGQNYIGGMGTPTSGLDREELVGKWSHVTWHFTGGEDGVFSVYLNGERVMQTGFNSLIDGLPASDIGSDRATIHGKVSLKESPDTDVTLYVGPVDIRFFEQFRRRHWEQIIPLGKKPNGEFSFDVQRLEPNTRYYYRLAVVENGKRVWSDDPVSFVTAGADGRGATTLPTDTDRMLFLGAHWGGTWYFPDPPSNFFDGHIADIKLYDYALSEKRIFADAGVTGESVSAVPLPDITPNVPRDGETVNRTGAMRWTAAATYIKNAKLILSTDREQVAQGTGHVEECGEHPGCNLDQSLLAPGKTYYWRVETTFTDGQINPGKVWSFAVRDYVELEADGPVCEPFPDGMHVLDEGGRIMQGLGQVQLSAPGATNENMFISTYSCDKLMHKRPDLVRVLEALSCGNQLVNHGETGRYHSGFNLECYGVLHGVNCGSNIMVHEFGHQFHDWGGACDRPDFNQRLTDIFNTHRHDLGWLGDYAASNTSEFMAVGVHMFGDAAKREGFYRKDPTFYWFLAEFLSGDTVIDLRARDGVQHDPDGAVQCWHNQGGLTKWVQGKGWVFMEHSQGGFVAVGAPTLTTVDHVAAVRFSGHDALAWNETTQQSLDTHRSWAVELWLRPETAGPEKQLLASWGDAAGVGIYLAGGEVVLSLQGRDIRTGVRVEPDRWSHLCCNYEGGGVDASAAELDLWLDGQEVYSAMETLNLPAGQQVVLGGTCEDDAVQCGYVGSMAHVRFYDYQMGDLQIKQHYGEECPAYRRPLCRVGGRLLVDLDSRYVTDCPAGYHQPHYPKSLSKNWLRSWNNHGTAGGRIHNDVYAYLDNYSGSRPTLREVEGVLAVDFTGQDRMVSAFDTDDLTHLDELATIEMFVFCREPSADQVVLQLGGMVLRADALRPGWQHVAMMRQDDEWTLYLDGEPRGTISVGPASPLYNRLHLGALYDGRRWTDYFDGAIACLRIHRLPLTEKLLQANAAERTQFQPRPVDPEPARHTLIELRADDLEDGLLERWENPSVIGGAFTAGQTSDLRLPKLASGLGQQGLSLKGRKRMISSFDTPAAIAQGVFTMVFQFHQDMVWNETDGYILAGWGRTGDTAILKLGAVYWPGDLLKCAAGDVAWDELRPCYHQWQHMVLSGDGRQLSAWIDGQPVVTADLPTPLPAGGQLFLGTLDPTVEGMNGVLKSMKLYDRVLSESEIQTLYEGEEVGGKELLIDVSSPEGADGDLVAELENRGTLGGVFANGPGDQLAPTVAEVDGRKAVLFDGERTYLSSNIPLPECLSADAPFSVEICARVEDVSQLRTLMTLAPYVNDLAGGRTTCRAVALSCGGTADPDTRNTCGYDKSNEGGEHRILGFTTGAKVREVYWEVDPETILNRWTTFKWEYEGGRHTRVRLYIDGELNNEMCFARLDTPLGYPMWIGCGWNTDTGEKNLFKGAIASVTVTGNPEFVDPLS